MNTKKITIVLSTLTAFVLVFTYCADIDFNNPLDKDGDNYLFGKENLPYESELLTTSDGYNADLFDPNIMCDVTPPDISLISYPDPLGKNQPQVFRNMMGRGGEEMDGAVRLGPNESRARLENPWTAEDNVRIYVFNPLLGHKDGLPLQPVWNSTAISPTDVLVDGGMYIIEYDARRPSNCAVGTPAQRTITRVINVVQTTQISTMPPVIALEGEALVTTPKNGTYTEFGLSSVRDAQDVGGEPIAFLDSIVIRRTLPTAGPVTRVDRIEVSAAAMWVTGAFANSAISMEEQTVTITYYVTSPNNDISNSVTRTVQVAPEIDTRMPVVQIILSKKARSVPLSDGTSQLVMTTAEWIHGNELYVSPGVADAYYIIPRPGAQPDTIRTAADGTLLKNQILPPQPPTGFGLRPVTYNHPGIPGVADPGSVTRPVYRTDNECKTPALPLINVFDPPATTPTLGPLTIPAGVPWNHAASTPGQQFWAVVTSQDEWLTDEVQNREAYRFETVLDHNPQNVLNADNPAAGLYVVYHIGLSRCGMGLVGVSRTVLVQ